MSEITGEDHPTKDIRKRDKASNGLNPYFESLNLGFKILGFGFPLYPEFTVSALITVVGKS